MPIKYIGRTTSFKGKSLWEIVGNLKNFGVGRMVVRSVFERYPEPSYMRIVKVEAVPNEPIRKVKVWVEKVFRGKQLPSETRIYGTSYKADYRLIPVHEEESYAKGMCHENKSTVSPYSQDRIVPPEMPLPPLLMEIRKATLRRKGIDTEVKSTIPRIIKQGPANRAKAVPNIDVENTVVIEKSPATRLYAGLKS